MQPTISGIPFLVHPVRDMARARPFCGGILGLLPGEAWGDKWVEYEVGIATLAPSSVVEGAQSGQKAGAAALEIPQFDELVAPLTAHGVKFLLESVDTEGCTFARFEDPEGNHLVLHRKHGAARP